MPQQIRKRFQQTVDYVTNKKTNEDLARGYVYRELYLRLRGAPTLTNANNSRANTARGDEWGVVKRIDIIANNTDVIKSISGTALWALNYFMYQTIPPITPTLADETTANPAFDSTLILPFWMPNSVRPIDTALDARRLSDLKIEVTWGTFTDVNSAASAWTTQPSLDVHSLESFGVSGGFSQWRVYEIEETITASTPRFQIKLPVGNMYRGFLINTTDGGADANDILNNFKWKSNTNVYSDQPAKVLQQSNWIRTGLPREQGGEASDIYQSMQRSGDHNIEGWYWYDHVTDGLLSESIDSVGFSQLELELDVSVGAGETKIYVYPMEIVPIRGDANNAAKAA